MLAWHKPKLKRTPGFYDDGKAAGRWSRLAADQRLCEGFERVSGSLLQQPTGLQPVDPLEAAVKHRAGGFAAQRRTTRGKEGE